MASSIDVTKPQYGNPTTESVRDNFDIASNEISSLQVDVSNRIIKSGDTMAGDLTLFADPTLSMHAANRAWVINQIRSTVNAPIYVGDYDALADLVLTSGQPAIVVNNPLPAAGSGNTQMYFTVKTGKPAPSIGNQPPGGVPVGSWLISNGINWNVYQPSAVGVVAQTVPVSPEIVSLPGTNVYAALQSVPTLYLPLVGGTLSGALTLFGNPVNPNHAANKTYVDSIPKVSTFNTRSGVVTLQQSDVSSVGVFNDSGRNLLHNSMFNIAQRGAGPFSTASAYTLDRWQLQFNSDTGVSVNQFVNNDTVKGQIGDESATYCISITTTGNSAASAFTEITQSMEGARRLSGKTVTVSFWAVVSAAGLKIGVSGYSNYGTGGSPSTSVGWGNNIITLGVNWARYSVTINIPTAIGKTIGTNNNDCNVLQLFFSSGVNNLPSLGIQSGTFQLWGMQLEIGSVMTPFEKIDPQQDLAKCQRFFQAYPKMFITGGTGPMYGNTSLLTRMRATPTVVLSAISYLTANSLSFSSATTDSVLLNAIGSGGAGSFAQANVAASADL